MIPDRGDIYHVDFDPASGSEMKGWHYALVVSKREFNQKFNLCFVCPISTGLAENARRGGFLVSLMGAGTGVQGNVHIHQLKIADLRSRQGKRIERAPQYIVDEVLMYLQGIFE